MLSYLIHKNFEKSSFKQKEIIKESNQTFFLQLQSAWAGYYDYNTLDQNAIIGRHPVLHNLLFANGFSGHGIQQSPAVGRAVSELIIDNKSHSIDISGFSFDRIVKGQPYKEKNIV